MLMPFLARLMAANSMWVLDPSRTTFLNGIIQLDSEESVGLLSIWSTRFPATSVTRIWSGS